MPLKDVYFGFNEILLKSPASFLTVLKYFEKNYIGELVGNSRTTRLAPKYPKEMWNLNERVLNSLPRTNNSIEAWHKQFELSCGKHPGVFKLIQCFREEQKLTELKLSKIKSGAFNHKNSDKELKIYI